MKSRNAKRVDALEQGRSGHDDDTPVTDEALLSLGIKTKGEVREAIDYIAKHGRHF